jgi:hypothetical protein
VNSPKAPNSSSETTAAPAETGHAVPPPNDRWNVALRRFVQKNDGKPFADLLRGVMPSDEGGLGSVPISIIYDLADLFDPQISWDRFAKSGKKSSGSRALRLNCKPLSKLECERIIRNQAICGRILNLLMEGHSVEVAVAEESERTRLSERQVKSIWSSARKAQPMLQKSLDAERKKAAETPPMKRKR